MRKLSRRLEPEVPGRGKGHQGRAGIFVEVRGPWGLEEEKESERV